MSTSSELSAINERLTISRSILDQLKQAQSTIDATVEELRAHIRVLERARHRLLAQVASEALPPDGHPGWERLATDVAGA